MTSQEDSSMKKNKEFLLFSLTFLAVLIYSSTLYLYKIQLGAEANPINSVILYIWNALFIIQVYLHFYSYLSQLQFTQKAYNLKLIYINKGYMLWYHIAICLFILFYFYLIVRNEMLDGLITVLTTGNLLLFQFSIIFKKSRRANPLKGEIRVDQFTFKEMASIVLLEFNSKVYYVTCDTSIESFEVFKYKVSEDKKYEHLYGIDQASPQMSMNFKKESKKKEEIISFLSEKVPVIE